MKKIITFLILVLSLCVNAQVCFNPASNHSLAGNPVSITSADFNMDGRADLAVAGGVDASSSNPNNVAILYGNGCLACFSVLWLPVTTSAKIVLNGDYNGDGLPDLAIVDGAPDINLYYSTSTGTFTSAYSYPVVPASSGSPIAIASADFNGDGMLDFVSADGAGGNLSILLHNVGTGGYGTQTYLSISGSAITSADFNGDSKLDLAVAGGIGSLSILLGTGTGSFSLPNYLTQVPNVPNSIISKDFNNDGKADLAFNYADSISILLGLGNGSFGTVSNFAGGSSSPYELISADFNGDSKLDLALANGDSNNVSVLLGTGTGSFGIASSFTVGGNPYVGDSRPYSICTADFNNDGKADIGTANFSSGDCSVLINCALVDIEQNNTYNGLNIYPNPAGNSFNIENTTIEKQTLQVFDVTGKIVLTQCINGKTNIDATNLSEGVYNISITNTNGILNKRLVIVR